MFVSGMAKIRNRLRLAALPAALLPPSLRKYPIQVMAGRAKGRGNGAKACGGRAKGRGNGAKACGGRAKGRGNGAKGRSAVHKNIMFVAAGTSGVLLNFAAES